MKEMVTLALIGDVMLGRGTKYLAPSYERAWLHRFQ